MAPTCHCSANSLTGDLSSRKFQECMLRSESDASPASRRSKITSDKRKWTHCIALHARLASHLLAVELSRRRQRPRRARRYRYHSLLHSIHLIRRCRHSTRFRLCNSSMKDVQRVDLVDRSCNKCTRIRATVTKRKIENLQLPQQLPEQPRLRLRTETKSPTVEVRRSRTKVPPSQSNPTSARKNPEKIENLPLELRCNHTRGHFGETFMRARTQHRLTLHFNDFSCCSMR